MARDYHYREEFESFMEVYETLGYMCLLDNAGQNADGNPSCYTAHHGIWQNADQGSKLRVAFDASRRSNSGRSLNDLLFVGQI